MESNFQGTEIQMAKIAEIMAAIPAQPGVELLGTEEKLGYYYIDIRTPNGAPVRITVTRTGRVSKSVMMRMSETDPAPYSPEWIAARKDEK